MTKNALILASAITALFASATVFAGSNGGGDNGGGTGNGGSVQSSVKLTNDISTSLSNSSSTSTSSNITVTGKLQVTNSAQATLDNKQISETNRHTDNGTINHTDSDDSFNGASGNIGLNQASGDGNQQANAVSLAVADAKFLWGAANANVTAFQDAHNNSYNTQGGANTAEIGGGSFNNAHGNIMVNNAAGNGNQQKNDLAVAMATKAISAEASIGLIQHAVANTYYAGAASHGPGVLNTDSINCAFNGAQGNIGVNEAAGNGNQQFNGLSVAVSTGGYTVGGRP